MKALVCTTPGELVLEDRPEPGPPGPGEARVRITHVGICGTDYHIWEGKHPFLQYPRVMGHEVTGVVEAGERLAPGTRVIVNPFIACGACIACRAGRPNCCTTLAVLGVHRDGCMTEVVNLPEGNLYPAGDLPPESAAAVEFLAIGAHAVRRAGRSDGRALVIGAGPIGLSAAIFARIAGQEVWIMDLAADRLAFAASLGFHAITPDQAEAARGEGFEVVYDATGHAGSMSGAWLHAAHGAALIYVGVTKEALSLPHPELHKRELTVMASRNAIRADFETVVAAMAAGHVPMDRIVTHRMGLEAAVTELPRLAHARAGLVKAVIAI